MVVAVELL
jgi:chromosome segregation ATPase